MATASAPQRVRERVRERPAAVTAVVSVLGYALVIGTFLLDIPIYPDLTRGTVVLLGDVIAAINSVALVALVAGWRWIRNGDVKKHRAAMLTAFTLILGFLAVYLLKVGGGGEKYIELAHSNPVYVAYITMLAIHIVLSVVAVPVVLYALVLGLTRSPAELRRTRHKQVGRVAAGSWTLSLALGIITYLLLNHVYSWTYHP